MILKTSYQSESQNLNYEDSKIIGFGTIDVQLVFFNLLVRIGTQSTQEPEKLILKIKSVKNEAS